MDRRVRELKSNNTKIFVEERKRQTMKHEREKDNLTKSHETQKTTLLAEIDKVSRRITDRPRDFHSQSMDFRCWNIV